ncbi:unnamed protein product [Meloidogyne enterolobii]|uniref:Uncharacterized protein n=1 Tax=Meloidogyne enterolobii TaxID=390850 RepID=A0ACB0YND3_MELEN
MCRALSIYCRNFWGFWLAICKFEVKNECKILKFEWFPCESEPNLRIFLWVIKTIYQCYDKERLSVSVRKCQSANLTTKKPLHLFNFFSNFFRICALSPELSDLLGKSYMRRSEVVKGVWTYLKSNNLQDPKKKQFYFLDDPLKRIFGSSKTKFKAFGMMGILNKHVKDVEFLDVESRRIAEAEIAKILDEENKTNKSAIHSDSGEEDEEGEEEEEMEGGNDGGNKLSNKSDDVSDEKKIGVKASSKASTSSEGEEEEEEE